MTRFARAKGSKSSNLKAPDDSTPWEVMKEQMLQAKKESEDNKNREIAENQRIENYNNFLKEQKVQKRKSTWCDFPEAEGNKKTKPNADETKPNKNKKKSKKNPDPLNEANVEETVNSNNINEVSNKQQNNNLKKSNKKKNKSKKIITDPNTSDQVNVQETFKSNIVSNASNEQQNGKNNNKNKNNLNTDTSNANPSDETGVQETVNNNIENNVSSKKKKRKNKNKTKVVPNGTSVNVEETDGKQEDVEQTEGTIKKNNNKHVSTDSMKSSGDQSNKKIISIQKKKNKKNRGDKPMRRKEINDRSFQLIINGKEVELIRFDGFPIMKKDAERLNELKTNMMKKGIPKTEVNRTIKLERRRAEKALARLKRDVCYNCRKGGHNLSDCPDLKSNIPGVGAAEGICFKCGSTEHRQFECKVQRDKEFRFASCFICKEQGHIARQCPDNPKGLYPNGGCCKLCGDVTHLRKDCPTIQNQKEGTSIKLQTLDVGNNIEDIDLQMKSVSEEAPKKPKKIMF